MAGWITDNWFNILSAAGIIGSLIFTAVSFRSDTDTRRISNLLTLTQNHRELWKEMFYCPSLKRVLDSSAHASAQPITTEEHFFVNMAIQHLSSAFQAMKTGLVIKPEGLSEDICQFFSLPIPRAIWEKIRGLQNEDFVKFVDQCLSRTEKRGYP